MKELSQLQVLRLAKEALENRADRTASLYGKSPEDSKREIIEKVRNCFDQLDWIESEIEKIRKENPTPPRLK